MVVVFVLFEVDVTPGGGCEIWEHWYSFREVKCLQSCSKVFVFGVTQGNEGAGSMQDLILLFCYKSGELRGKESPRFPCVVIPGKITCEEAFQVLMKPCVSFGGIWRALMKKKWGATEGRSSIVKYVETPFEETACENSVGLSMYGDPIETV